MRIINLTLNNSKKNNVIINNTSNENNISSGFSWPSFLREFPHNNEYSSKG